jgi:hypothetical protein
MNQCHKDIIYLTLWCCLATKLKAVFSIYLFVSLIAIDEIFFLLGKKIDVFMFFQPWLWRLLFSGLWRRAFRWMFTDVSDRWYYLHLQRRAVCIQLVSCSQFACFSFRLWRWRQNVLPITFEIIADYTASHPRRMYSPLTFLNSPLFWRRTVTSKKWVPDEMDLKMADCSRNM